MVGKKRILAMLMAIVMMLSMLPMQVLATEAAEAIPNNEVSVIATETTVSLLDEAVSFTLSGYGSAKSDDTYLEYKYNNSGAAYTDQITVTNNTGTDAYPERMQFSFQVYASVIDVSVGNDPVVLLPGQSITITYKVPDGSKYIALEEFALTPIVSRDVQFTYDAALGKVAVGGTDVESGYTREIPDTGVTVTAKPNEGVTFLGWVDQSGKIIPGSETITLNPTVGMTGVRPAFATANSKAWFKTSGYMFDSLNAANEHLKTSGGTITLAADGVLTEDAEISEKVTLLIPYNASEELCTTAPNVTQNDMVTPSAFRTMTMASGVTLTVKGALSVAGTATAETYEGHVYGPYGHIKMQANSLISIEDKANLYAWGFISGNGAVEVLNGGTAYENFQTLGWRGGDAINSINNSASTYKVFPLSQFYVQNVEVPMTFYAGAEEKVFFVAVVFGSSEQTALPTFIGDDGLFRIDSGSITKDYNEATDYMDFTVNGSVRLESITIRSGITLNSANYHLPIPNHFKITIVSGANLDIKNDCAVLPGAEFYVKEGAAVNVAAGKSVIVYDLDEWSTKEAVTFSNREVFEAGHGFVFIGDGNRHIRPVLYTTSRGTKSPRGTDTSKLSDAKIRLDGTLNAAGAAIYTTVGGADISSTGCGKLVIGAVSGSITEYQLLQGGSKNGELKYVSIANTPAKLKNADGSYVETAGTAQTLYYNDGVWGNTEAEKTAKLIPADGSAAIEFYSVQNALEAAVNAGDCVALMSNVALTDTLEVQSGYNVVLDLNGYTISETDGSVLINNGQLKITDSSSGDTKGKLVTAKNDVTDSSNVYRFASTIINHGTMELENVSIETGAATADATNYRIGLLNYPEGIIKNIDGVTINGFGKGSYAIYNFGNVQAVGDLDITAENGYTVRDVDGKTGVFGTENSTITINASNMAFWVRNGATVDTIGAAGSTIYMDKGRTVADGKVTSTVGNTGIYVSTDSKIDTIGGAGSTINIAMKNAIWGTGSNASVYKIVKIGEAGSTINITATENAIQAAEGAFIGTVGNGGTMNISGGTAVYADGSGSRIDVVGASGSVISIDGCKNGIYANNAGEIGIVGQSGSTIDMSVSAYGFYTKGAGYESKIGTIGNGGNITVNAGSIGICINNNANSVGTIAKTGTVTVIATGGNAIHMGRAASITEIGKGLTAITTNDGSYALRISGASDELAAATVGLISGGYYSTPKNTRAYAVDGYANRTYPTGYSLVNEPVTIKVGNDEYSAFAVSHAHSYGDVVFNWADDYSSATASITCSKCAAGSEGHSFSGECVVTTAANRGHLAVVTLNGKEYTDIKYVMEGMSFAEDSQYAMKEFLDTAPVTFEAWVNVPANTNRTSTILGSYSGSAGKFIDLELQANGYPRLCWSDKATSSASTGSIKFTKGSVFTGEWEHIAVVYDEATNSATYYLNGEFVETIALASTNTSKLSGAITTTKQLVLGADFRKDNANWFPGKIASVAVYSDARTAAEIKSDMLAPGAHNLLVHYELNRASATGTIKDLSGNGYHIGACEHSYTVSFSWAGDYSSATASYSCASCGESGTMNGTIASMGGRYEASVVIEGETYTDRVYALSDGMEFDNSKMYSMDKPLDVVPHTYEAWIKLPANAKRSVILGSYNAVSAKKYINFEITANGEPRLCWHDGTAAGSMVFEGLDVRTGEWLHLAITNDGTDVKCYINGVLAATKDAPTSSSLDKTMSLAEHLALGNDYRTNTKYPFDGEIASVAVYTDVRDADEIYKDMIAPVKAEDLLIHYELNSNSGNAPIKDLSGNGYDIGKCAHSYTVSFSWAGDYSSATVTAVCSKCTDAFDGHSVTANAVISAVTNRGYKAAVTIDGKEYTDIKYVMEGMSFAVDTQYAMKKYLGTAPVTFEAWVNVPANTTRASTILGSYSGGAGKFIDLELQANGYPRLCWSDKATSSGSTGSIKFTKGSVFTGEWEHIAVVYDEATNSATYYLNGEFVETIALASTNTSKLSGAITTTKQLVLGADFRKDNANWFPGKIASVAVYSDARTAAEIKSDMLAPAADNLLIHYEVNRSSVTGTIKDLSGNGYDIYYPWVAGKEPGQYDYSFMVIGDTQKAVRLYPEKVSKIYDYVLNNVATKNVKFVFGLGDIVDYNILTEAGLTPQWEAMADQIKRMNGVVPYSVIRGNHDEVENFNKYFAIAEYKDSLGGYLNDMRNTWQTFEVGNIKYLVLNLDFGPTADMIEWANEVIETHPNYNVIITTHSYLQKDGTTLDGAESASPTRCYKEWGSTEEHYDGDDMWNALVSKHDNIVMLLCGHDPSSAIVTVRREGENGNVVTQMLIDGQDDDKNIDGGAGLVATFYIKGNNVTVDYYSTFHDKYYLEENQFTTTMDVHAWDNGRVVNAPTCTEDGTTIYTCGSCGTNHTKEVTVPATGHSFSEEWSTDAKNHWHACENGCDAISGEAAHADVSKKDHKCDACAYEMTSCADSEKTTSYARVEGTEIHTVTVTCNVCQQQVGQVTTEDCADANGDEACDLCEGYVAPKGYGVKIVNYTAGTNAAAVTIGGETVEYRQKEAVDAMLGADGVITVASAQQCIVAITTEEGVYTEVEAASNTDGVYNFTIAEPSEGMTIVVIFKGDVDEDGFLLAADAAVILRAVAKLEELSNLQNIVARVEGNSYISSSDAAKILRVVAKLDPGF